MVRVKLRVIKLPIYLATVRKATWSNSNSCIICITVYRNQHIIRRQPRLLSDNRLIWHNGNRKTKKSLKYQFIICGLKKVHQASAKLMIISNWIILFALILTFLLISHNLRRKKRH